MCDEVLKRYAELVAKCGVNIRPGQEVFVVAELDQPKFVEMVVEACYEQGASKVIVDWTHQPLSRLNYKYCTVEALSTFEDYQRARWEHYVKTIPCRIYIESEDPDGLSGVDLGKMIPAVQAIRLAQKPYRDELEGKYQWTIVAVPGEKWAKKLFPELPMDEAIEALWNAILKAARADTDPIKQWQLHNDDLKSRCDHLNGLDIDTLHYTSANGTDFTVGLIPETKFCGGGEWSLQHIFFNPNIPSEECFISPRKDTANGIVYSSMPLSYQGQLIENFNIRFENGRAVEWHAEKNEELLASIINTDEGSAYLGECALVPYDSPIRNSGLLFYNTLFDENAACHLALGFGFPDTLREYGDDALERAKALGINDSATHIDFMIGTPDLCIEARTRNGKTVPIFQNGNWAF